MEIGCTEESIIKAQAGIFRIGRKLAKELVEFLDCEIEHDKLREKKKSFTAIKTNAVRAFIGNYQAHRKDFTLFMHFLAAVISERRSLRRKEKKQMKKATRKKQESVLKVTPGKSKQLTSTTPARRPSQQSMFPKKDLITKEQSKSLRQPPYFDQ